MPNLPGDLIGLVNGESKGSPPPPTDDFFPRRSILARNLFDVLKMGLAIGLAAAIVFLLMTLISAIFGGSVLEFLRLLYPGLIPSLLQGLLIAFVLTYAFSFIFGSLVALVYNSLVLESFQDKSSYETHVTT